MVYDMDTNYQKPATVSNVVMPHLAFLINIKTDTTNTGDRIKLR